MAIVQANAADSEVGILAFASNGTTHPDAFVVINSAEQDKTLELRCSGGAAQRFQMFRTSPQEHYADLGTIHLREPMLQYTAPADSVTTFFARA